MQAMRRLILLVSALASLPASDALRSEPPKPQVARAAEAAPQAQVAKAARAAPPARVAKGARAAPPARAAKGAKAAPPARAAEAAPPVDEENATLPEQAARAAPPKKRAPKEAYVFMSYGKEAHKPGLMTVIFNLREFDKTRDIVVITPLPAPTQMRKDLRRLNAKVLEMPSVQGPEFCVGNMGRGKERLLNSFFKLNVWNLTQYDAVLYLESDMLIRESLEEIFRKFRSVQAKDAVMIAPMGARQCPGGGDWLPTTAHHMWNTGIMAIRPTAWFAETYWEVMRSGDTSSPRWRSATCQGGSQNLENILFKDYLQSPYHKNESHLVCLPLRYNCKDARCVDDAAVVHWTGEHKPWDGGKGFENYLPDWEEKRRKAAEAAGIKLNEKGIARERLFRQLALEWARRQQKVTELMSAPDPEDEGKVEQV